jgi:hypothetical protein
MSSVNEIIFFILLGVFFIIFFLSTNYFYEQSNSRIKKGTILSISAMVFSLFFLGYTQVTGVCKNEGYMDYDGKIKHTKNQKITYSPSTGAKLCRGGPYTWQGDSQRARFCRDLASTPEGLAEINRYSCGAGYNGMPGNGFKFTPLSDDNWNNARCDGSKDYIDNNGIF